MKLNINICGKLCSIFFIFIFDSCSQKNSCDEALSDSNIKRAYERSVEGVGKQDLIDSIIFILEDEKSKIEKIDLWVKSEGYHTAFYTIERADKAHLTGIRFAKKIDKISLDFFSNEIKKLEKKRKEYDIKDCPSHAIKYKTVKE
jgi:hypothetical protein